MNVNQKVLRLVRKVISDKKEIFFEPHCLGLNNNLIHRNIYKLNLTCVIILFVIIYKQPQIEIKKLLNKEIFMSHKNFSLDLLTKLKTVNFKT